MARVKIAGTSGASENTIVFSSAGGHSHNGQNSSLIDSTAYSMYDFSPTFVGTEVNPDRAVRQENNRIAFEDVIKRVVNNSVLAPAGIRLEPGSLNGSLIIANTITANQLAANTITASEISAGTITANELSSNIVLINNRITSQNWNGTIQANGTIYSNGIGSAGWAITNTHAVFDSTLIRGSIAANSIVTPGLTIYANGAITSNNFSTTTTGVVTATNAVLSGSITSSSGTIGGWTIQSNRLYGGSTYLYSNGQITSGNFNVTSGGVLSATGASISGTLTSSAGTIGGWTINASSISAGSTALYSNGYVSAASGSFSGAITASSGSFSGTITSGGAHFGVMVPGGGYYKGINLSPNSSTQFQSCFLRGDGGEVYLRADNGSQWIKFENGTVQINAVGFSVDGGSATFSGAITAGSITGTAISAGSITGTNIYGSSITSDSSILVGSSTSLGYMSLNTGSDLIVNGMRFQNRQYAGWHNTFYPYTDGQYDLSVVTNPSAGVYRWDNIYYLGSIVDQSDRREKNTIEDSDLGLDFINMLRPVSYFKNASKKYGRQDENGNYLRDENENILYDIAPGKRRHYGLIAQEVRQVISDLGKTSFDFSGWGQHDPDDPESEQTLTYMEFISPAIKAIQELSEKVTSLEARLQALEAV